MSQPIEVAAASRKWWVAAGLGAALALCAALLFSPAGVQLRAAPGLEVDVRPESAQRRVPRVAEFGATVPASDTRFLANWVADTRDNAAAPFFILDKKAATLYAFNDAAQLLASSPVLLGATAGDDSAPGIGNKPLAQVLQVEKTTPAGRFVAERGHNTGGEDVVWVDYDAAVSMHRVRANNPAERRLQRLATATPDDNRISFGCINVPVAFYDTMIRPVFAAQRAMVYVLPEVKSLSQVFGAYDVAQRSAEPAHAQGTLGTERMAQSH